MPNAALLQNVDPRHIPAITAAFEPAKFAAGSQLFHEGDHGNDLFLIDTGVVRLQQEREEIDGDAVLGFIDPGQIVGEVAVIDGGARSASAYAQTDVTARRLTRAGLERLTSESPAAGAALLSALARVVAGKLRHTSDRLAAEIFTPTDPAIDALVARAVAAQRVLAGLPDAQVDTALAGLSAAAAAAAEELLVFAAGAVKAPATCPTRSSRTALQRSASTTRPSPDCRRRASSPRMRRTA
ncbi:MAG TPA: cyclic nucleotide-binding domain-containing protein [Hyphomicrobiaceae bacterium]|nr:cyclic nucleotide-binding domain-containing protein [Hyphomicrobiaceae bacterium]